MDQVATPDFPTQASAPPSEVPVHQGQRPVLLVVYEPSPHRLLMPLNRSLRALSPVPLVRQARLAVQAASVLLALARRASVAQVVTH